VMLDEAIHHNSENNRGNWNKKVNAATIVLSFVSSAIFAAIDKPNTKQRPSAWKRT
jgi:hypothetical protein